MTDKAEFVVVPKAEHDAVIQAARDLCEIGPNEHLRERLRKAGIAYHNAPKYEAGDAVEAALKAWFTHDAACEREDESMPAYRSSMSRAITAAFPALVARVGELESDAAIGAKWRADSNLETWFPYTAQQLSELQAEVERLKGAK